MPAMLIEFCLPTSGKAVPSGPDWIHEINYDGYRLRVERHGDRVKLTSRGGMDWTRRFPWIVETARKIRKTQFIIDGEAVLLGVDGISDFNGLHSGEHNAGAALCLRHAGWRRRRHAQAAAVDAQDQSGAAAAGPRRGHLRRGSQAIPL